MITDHRMRPKIWRIQRIKILGITESKRKPLDDKARQRVGMIAKTPETRMNTGFLKAQTGAWQRFGNI